MSALIVARGMTLMVNILSISRHQKRLSTCIRQCSSCSDLHHCAFSPQTIHCRGCLIAAAATHTAATVCRLDRLLQLRAVQGDQGAVAHSNLVDNFMGLPLIMCLLPIVSQFHRDRTSQSLHALVDSRSVSAMSVIYQRSSHKGSV